MTLYQSGKGEVQVIARKVMSILDTWGVEQETEDILELTWWKYHTLVTY